MEGVHVFTLISGLKFQCVTHPLDQKKFVPIVEGVDLAVLVGMRFWPHFFGHIVEINSFLSSLSFQRYTDAFVLML